MVVLYLKGCHSLQQAEVARHVEADALRRTIVTFNHVLRASKRRRDLESNFEEYLIEAKKRVAPLETSAALLRSFVFVHEADDNVHNALAWFWVRGLSRRRIPGE